MTFLIEADYRELEHEFDRMEHEPTTEHLIGFEMVLASSFADATSHVHVITGALRGSGKTTSDADEERNRWEGQMTWGGPSPGFLPRPHVQRSARQVNRPLQQHEAEVVYAWYEKRRGLAHNFLVDQDAYTAEFKAAFEAAVRGQ